jgi:ABC-type dipeptide/oligopeptide/nickel transport system permease component
LLRRVIWTVLALFAVSILILALLDFAPGDAAEAIIGDSGSAAQLQALRAEMGLESPLPLRYLRFLDGLLRKGDMGKSLITEQQVATLVAARLPYTLLLAFAASGLALLIGVPLSLAAALRPGSWLDTSLMSLSSLGLAMPTFWTAILFTLVFSLKLDWLPVVGAGSWKHLILPTITLALPTASIIARVFRSSLLEEMRNGYVLTAHSKGLHPRRVLTIHVFRNSLIPLITLLGMHLGHLLGGAFIVETIFGWPGLGRLTVLAIFDRDVPVVMGAALATAAMFLTLNLVIDITYGWLDPRVAENSV